MFSTNPPPRWHPGCPGGQSLFWTSSRRPGGPWRHLFLRDWPSPGTRGPTWTAPPWRWGQARRCSAPHWSSACPIGTSPRTASPRYWTPRFGTDPGDPLQSHCDSRGWTENVSGIDYWKASIFHPLPDKRRPSRLYRETPSRDHPPPVSNSIC